MLQIKGNTKNLHESPKRDSGSIQKTPTTKVEINTPIVENAIIDMLSDFNFFASICIAPAKSKKLSITFIRATVLKSIAPITCNCFIKKMQDE